MQKYLVILSSIYPAAGFKNARYIYFLPGCQVKVGKTDKFSKRNKHGKVYLYTPKGKIHPFSKISVTL